MFKKPFWISHQLILIYMQAKTSTAKHQFHLTFADGKKTYLPTLLVFQLPFSQTDGLACWLKLHAINFVAIWQRNEIGTNIFVSQVVWLTNASVTFSGSILFLPYYNGIPSLTFLKGEIIGFLNPPPSFLALLLNNQSINWEFPK